MIYDVSLLNVHSLFQGIGRVIEERLVEAISVLTEACSLTDRSTKLDEVKDHEGEVLSRLKVFLSVQGHVQVEVEAGCDHRGPLGETRVEDRSQASRAQANEEAKSGTE